MRSATLTFVLPALLVAGAAIAAGATAHDPKAHSAATQPSSHGAGSMELHRIMTEGKKMPMPAMSGNVDKDFAAMMSMHHQEAIKMAEVELQHGQNAQLKALAAKMKAAQQEEIKQMASFTK